MNAWMYVCCYVMYVYILYMHFCAYVYVIPTGWMYEEPLNIYMHMCVCVCVYTHVCMCVRVYVCVHIYTVWTINVYMYVYKHVLLCFCDTRYLNILKMHAHRTNTKALMRTLHICLCACKYTWTYYRHMRTGWTQRFPRSQHRWSSVTMGFKVLSCMFWLLVGQDIHMSMRFPTVWYIDVCKKYQCAPFAKQFELCSKEPTTTGFPRFSSFHFSAQGLTWTQSAYVVSYLIN
jgi:hypothetical protein